VRLYLDAIGAADKDAARTLLLMTRGAQADKDGFKQLMKELW